MPIDKKAFKTICKAWLNHKLILAAESLHYRQPDQQRAIKFIRDHLSGFLFQPECFSSFRLARVFVNNLKKMQDLLPNPNNPAYASSSELLDQIIEKSKELLTEPQ
jgi:hypothetical protein